MSGGFRKLAGMALAMALCAPAFGAERCATGPRIEGRYTIDTQAFVVSSSRRMKLVAVCLAEEPKAKKVLPLAGDDDCQMANAKLRIRAFEYVAGRGVDEDGPFLPDYEIIRLGKSKKCVFN